MIEINDINLKIKSKRVLRNIKIKIKPNQSVALLGHNGSGKSSIIDVITGAVKAEDGNVAILGKNYPQVKEKFGVMYEYMPLFIYWKVKELLTYTCIARNIKYSSIIYLIESLGINTIINKLINVLSKGERKKVHFLITILHNPEILILDEPSSDLDPWARSLMWKHIKQDRRTILFTTHLWEEAMQNADSVILISSGEILAFDSIEKVLSNKYIKGRIKIEISQYYKNCLSDELKLKYDCIEGEDNLAIFCDNKSLPCSYLDRLNVSYTTSTKSLEDVYKFLQNNIHDPKHKNHNYFQLS